MVLICCKPMPFFGLVTKRQFGHQPKLAHRAGDGLTTGLNGKSNAGGSLQATAAVGFRQGCVTVSAWLSAFLRKS